MLSVQQGATALILLLKPLTVLHPAPILLLIGRMGSTRCVQFWESLENVLARIHA